MALLVNVSKAERRAKVRDLGQPGLEEFASLD
jgi:hypothetical protein